MNTNTKANKFTRVRGALRYVCKSSWLLPLGFLLLCVFCACCPLTFLWRQSSVVWARVTDTAWAVSFCLGMLYALFLALWLVVMTLWAFWQHRPMHTLRRWLCTLLMSGVGFCALMFSYLAMVFSDVDHSADAFRLPSDVALEVPQDMTLFSNLEAPAEVRQMVEEAEHARQQPEEENVDVAGSAEDGCCEMPHFDRLAQEHPELLRRLLERSVVLGDSRYADARSRGVVVQEKECRCWHCHLWLALQGKDELVPGVNRDDRWSGQEGRRIYREGAHGWRIVGICKDGWIRGELIECPPLVTAAQRRLDAALAPLAAEPTPETLDRLLPLPELPCLRLRETLQAGIYEVVLLVPRGDGITYTVEVSEYHTGTPLRLDRSLGASGSSPRRQGAEFDYYRSEVTVYTGNWGQFYGSTWCIKADGKPVRKQHFLMQGWER
ncbi:MAG: hypothetical protein ACI4O9_03545 [Akkermansia sp.]